MKKETKRKKITTTSQNLFLASPLKEKKPEDVLSCCFLCCGKGNDHIHFLQPFKYASFRFHFGKDFLLLCAFFFFSFYRINKIRKAIAKHPKATNGDSRSPTTLHL